MAMRGYTIQYYNGPKDGLITSGFFFFTTVGFTYAGFLPGNDFLQAAGFLQAGGFFIGGGLSRPELAKLITAVSAIEL